MSLPQALSADRRRHDRVPLRAAAVLVLADGRRIAARSIDMGKGGAGVVCDLNLAVGAQLTLQMNLPGRTSGSAPFEAPSTVANCTLAASDGGFRLGLQFSALSASAQAALKQALPL